MPRRARAGTGANVSRLTVAIAAHIRGAMATRTPAVRPAELARMTGLDPSSLSRMLKPSKMMTIEELVTICDALGLGAGAVLDSARRVVAEHEADELRAQVKLGGERAGGRKAG